MQRLSSRRRSCAYAQKPSSLPRAENLRGSKANMFIACRRLRYRRPAFHRENQGSINRFTATRGLFSGCGNLPPPGRRTTRHRICGRVCGRVGCCARRRSPERSIRSADWGAPHGVATASNAPRDARLELPAPVRARAVPAVSFGRLSRRHHHRSGGRNGRRQRGGLSSRRAHLRSGRSRS
jgi:hypothetical protein